VEARGVQVRILTNSLQSNNHLAAHAAYRGYIRSLVGHGVELYELRADAVDRSLYMEHPVDDKHLGLHAKFLLVDDDQVFVGSANLDSRSLKLNTEVGLLIESRPLNQALRQLIEVDFAPRNAWSVQLDPGGKIIWVGGSQVLSHVPADSAFQRLEDWFIGLLPIDSQM
jgi:putative cardiolipin synthase